MMMMIKNHLLRRSSMRNYHTLLENVLFHGDDISDERTGVGTFATFGEQLKFHDVTFEFPAITTKKLAWKSVVSELLWFLRGSSNVDELRAILHGEQNRFNPEKKTIWDGNYENQAMELGYSHGEMGDIYGVQWRNFGKEELYYPHLADGGTTLEEISGVDQIKLVIEEAKANPSSRRLIVSAWNPKVVWDYEDSFVEVKKAALPPCHMLFQLNIVGERIDLQWYQRSVDCFLGLPFNIASYALLLHIFARILGLEAGQLIGSLGNTHIYKNHVSQVEEQLTRSHFDAPKLWINPDLKTLDDFLNASVDDFKLINYESHGTIKAKMAV